ncbi:MAG TPA: pitrilysin family protein [Pyrinomonadaceae bacterium]|nr:pitrilysin family protein [Pyrinomonadaceae bacterium]
MRKARLFAIVLGLSLVLPGLAAAQPKSGGNLPPVKYEQFTLPNGLNVIMHVDKSTPIVAVDLWYHVGSKNEVRGRTGFAHLFEHMMFQGSKNYNDDYFRPLQEAGANINGSTNADRTNYYEILPSNFLELALFMEADRMGGLLDAMTMEKLNNQRDVVKNERRQSYENQPYGTAQEKIAAIMYPADHPYHWTTIGSLDDLTAASMEDVKAFFRQYYVPNNASLVIAGDFDTKKARGWVEKYFGPIPRGAAVVRPKPAAPKFDAEIRKSVEDDVPLPRLYMIWHTVPRFAGDDSALSMLGSVLSSGRNSRLQSNLMYGKQLAQEVGAFQQSREIAGSFSVTTTARPGKSLDEIEKEILAEIERIKKEPPTAEEMERALNQIESQAVYALQTVFGRADQMNNYFTMRGRPDYFQQNLDEFRKVTAADVQRVAQTYLTDKKLVMSYVRRQGAAQSVAQNSANTPTSTAAKQKEEPDSSKLPKPGPDPKLVLPKIEKNKLSNGLEVWLVHQNELPIVSMNLVVKTGGTADPKAGVANMTASLLDDGTKTRSVTEISKQLQSIGAQLNTGSDWDSSNVSLLTLTRNLDKALEVFSDVVVNPTFPETEFEVQRRRNAVQFLQRKNNANQIANIAYSSLLYGKTHPYGRPLAGDEESLKALTRDDLQKFYDSYYRPNNSVLIVAGEADAKTLMPKLEKAFETWKASTVTATSVPPAPRFEQPGIYIVDRPGAAQSVVTIGQIGVDRSNPDYFSLLVMNSILGGQFSSRVNMNLREDKGYTYGARSGWSFRRGAGPFSASADVQTAVTRESIQEFMKELNGIRGSIPVTQKELDYNKQSIIRRYPGAFETVGQISNQLSNLVVFGLPDSYFNDYIAKVNAVTVADVNRVANKYLDPSKMAILIVGDRKVIEPKLKELNGFTIAYLDVDGRRVAE